MNKKNVIWLFLMLVGIIVISGCTRKLANKSDSFSDQGITYTIQLPNSWQMDTKNLGDFGERAVFSAKDKNSNSTMFASSIRKEQIDLTDFGTKTREQLKESYHYTKVEDVYMNEFQSNGFSAYKYTVFTKYKNKEFWAHIYYIETKTGMVQLVYYSADDSDYKERSKIIDQSARTLKETAVDNSYDPAQNQTKETSSTSEEQVVVSNDNYTFTIKGFRKIENEQEEHLVIIRFETTNHTEQVIQPTKIVDFVTVTQNNHVLKKTIIPAVEKDTALGVLEQQQDKALEKDQSAETILAYVVENEKNEVVLTFSENQFPNQEPVILDLNLLQ